MNKLKEILGKEGLSYTLSQTTYPLMGVEIGTVISKWDNKWTSKRRLVLTPEGIISCSTFSTTGKLVEENVSYGEGKGVKSLYSNILTEFNDLSNLDYNTASSLVIPTVQLASYEAKLSGLGSEKVVTKLSFLNKINFNSDNGLGFQDDDILILIKELKSLSLAEAMAEISNKINDSRKKAIINRIKNTKRGNFTRLVLFGDLLEIL